MHYVERETSQGIFVVWERLTKIQATSRPENVWPEVWTKFGKAAQKREKPEWANEKPKLDNARWLRGIYFIDVEDAEYEDALKNARRNLEVPMDAAMPCKKGTKKHFPFLRTEHPHTSHSFSRVSQHTFQCRT